MTISLKRSPKSAYSAQVLKSLVYSSHKFVNTINPNWTGWGQSWPRRLWPQITGNFVSTSHFFFDLFLQKRLPDLFELLTWPQKMTFKRPFWRFFVRNPAAAFPAEPEKNSNQFPVAGRVECGGRRVLSRARSLALSKWTAGAAAIWGISRNRRPLYRGDTSYTPPSS